MKTTKIWLGVGAFVVAGSGAAPLSSVGPLDARALERPTSIGELKGGTSIPRLPAPGLRIAAMKHGGEAGEAGEAGEKGAAKLSPDLEFALKIALIRGHLLVGDKLVKLGQWNAAFPHFKHPTEELYGGIRAHLKDYKTPPFSAALKVLSIAVKMKKRDQYDRALAVVLQVLATADAGVKAKQQDWASFVVETAVEALKTATGEYEEAIVKGRIAKPVEYQDARGFVWQAETMIESVAPALEKKNAGALKQVRADLAELKKAWPAAVPPKTPVKDYGAVLSDVSRIELHAGKLM